MDTTCMGIRGKSRDFQTVEFGSVTREKKAGARQAPAFFNLGILRRLRRLRMKMLVAFSVDIVLLPMQRRV
jgi:hypothetical protein